VDERRQSVRFDVAGVQLSIRGYFDDVAAVDASYRAAYADLQRDGSRARIHPARANTHRDTAARELCNRVAIALVHFTVRVEQRPVEIGDEQLVARGARQLDSSG